MDVFLVQRTIFPFKYINIHLQFNFYKICEILLLQETQVFFPKKRKVITIIEALMFMPNDNLLYNKFELSNVFLILIKR